MTRQGYTLENTRKNMAMTRQNPWHDQKILKAKQEKKTHDKTRKHHDKIRKKLMT